MTARQSFWLRGRRTVRVSVAAKKKHNSKTKAWPRCVSRETIKISITRRIGEDTSEEPEFEKFEVGLSPNLLAKAFPFHFVVDVGGRFTQVRLGALPNNNVVFCVSSSLARLGPR